MLSHVTPADVVRRHDGSLYVITEDELPIIKALGVTNAEYAEMV